MKKSTLTICVLVFAVVTWGTLAYAETLVANIPFSFKAVGKEYPAGKYRIEVNVQSEVIKLMNEATGQGALLPFTSLLSERDEALVVFDKKGDQYYLSEVYIPGIDGYEFKGATGKHTHVKVKGSGK